MEYYQGAIPGRRPILKGPDAHETFDEIPVIDMTDMDSPSLVARQAVADKVAKACTEVGFFYALNHPVPQDIIDEAFKTMAQYFSQPDEVKMKNHSHNRPDFRGFEPVSETRRGLRSKGDIRESFFMGYDETDSNQNLPFPPVIDRPPRNTWPASNDAFRHALTEYYNHVHAFSVKLLRIFALALGIEETSFDKIATFPMAFMRAIHYLGQKSADGKEGGISAHTDYVTFTVLCQDTVEGLEVLNLNGMWIPAPYIPRTFVINIADHLQLLTNHHFKSTVHRVVNRSGRERYSIPFFFSFDKDAELEVLPSFKVDGAQEEKTNVGANFKERQAAQKIGQPDDHKGE